MFVLVFDSFCGRRLIGFLIYEHSLSVWRESALNLRWGGMGFGVEWRGVVGGGGGVSASVRSGGPRGGRDWMLQGTEVADVSSDDDKHGTDEWKEYEDEQLLVKALQTNALQGKTQPYPIERKDLHRLQDPCDL